MKIRVAFAVTLLLVVCASFSLAERTGVPFVAEDGSYAEASDGAAFDMDQFTLAAWVKLNGSEESQIFLSRGEAGKLFTLYQFTDGIRMLVQHRPDAYTKAVAKRPKAGVWTHYAGTYDGKEIRLYVNGKLAAKTAAEGRIPKSKAPLTIGALAPRKRTLDGKLDDARVWNRALSDEEIAAVFKGDAADEGMVAEFTADSLDGDVWKNTVDANTTATYYAKTEKPRLLQNRKLDGYRGIWYCNQGQGDKYVYKYSGGLGTYCAKHRPFAVYCPEVDKTFFVYGGTDEAEETLYHMVSYFDHKTKTVPRPTFLLDKKTNDAHDNPVMSVDENGYIWIFSSSHGTSRPSYILKSKKPYDIDEFERILTTNFSYTQPWYIPGKGFMFMQTIYRGGRALYFQRSADGVKWTEPKLLALIDQGHYQITGACGKRVATTFNYHPQGKGLNWRTNLYYMETDDMGRTWRNIHGEEIELPLTTIDNKALIRDYAKEKRNVYVRDLVFDKDGNPLILSVTSGGWQSGPVNDPRTWETAHWNGKEWEFGGTIASDNNYDTGSVYIEDDCWRIIGPTETGPQEYNTGGEMAMWTSKDHGKTWQKVKDLTKGSKYNHTFARRPVNAHPDFYAIWADGHGRKKSDSRLYFTDKEGTHVWRLPVKMEGDTAKPEIVEDFSK